MFKTAFLTSTFSALALASAAVAQTAPDISKTEKIEQTSSVASVGSIETAVAPATSATPANNGEALVWSTAEGPTPRGVALIEELGKAGDYGLDTDALKIPALPAKFETSDQQRAYDQVLTKAALAYAHQARGGRMVDPSRVSTTLDMKPTLVEPKAVLETLAAAEDVAAALRSFHPAHAGFTHLQKALVVARDSKAPAETMQRITVNLERWRWMPADLGAFHVWNNTPEQITRVVKNGDIVHTERIVVGKPGHSTPVMSADMKYIIFHPSWGVPAGIKQNEIGPQLKRASARSASLFDGFGEGGSGRVVAVLARHQLRVSHNGREINPDSVDWRTVDVRQFHFTQPPSNKNVLGVVKFRFPNKYDVYMHDTQDRHLFSHPVRAYSHGCMRVQNPVRFAGVLLGHDKGWSQEKVDAFVPGGRSADITLTTPIPVHLTYFTASADETGKLTLHGDIYGMDSRVASAIAGKPVALAGAKVSIQTAAARPLRTGAAASPRDGQSGQSWNPFALSSN